MASVVTPERYASGMTFDEYVAYIGTAENLKREGSGGSQRRDFSTFFRVAFEERQLSEPQLTALNWLVTQPGGPAKMLVISEDWSSDCRRDVPTFARIAAETGMDLRIFRRDGQRFSDANLPSLEDAPDSNADIMSEFLNHKNHTTYQSIPVCVFYDGNLEYLYHFTEYPAIYEKDRIMARIRDPLPGESAQDAAARTGPAFQNLQDSEFFRIWASASVDEIVSALHRRLLLGAV